MPTTSLKSSSSSWKGGAVPRRSDINKILIIGSGPIIISQACEFDYSGTQACKVLREDGFEVVLINSNPATIMTDPGTADATYIEPLTLAVLTRIIEQEKPQALLGEGEWELDVASKPVEFPAWLKLHREVTTQ